MSQSKKIWTGNRLETIQKQPLFSAVKYIEPQNKIITQNLSQSDSKARVSHLLSPGNSPRQSTSHTPNRPRREKDANEANEYGFQNQTIIPYSGLFPNSPKIDETLRSYEPSTFTSQSKRRLLSKIRSETKLSSRNGLRAIFERARNSSQRTILRSTSPKSAFSPTRIEMSVAKNPESGDLNSILKSKLYNEQDVQQSSLVLENTSLDLEDECLNFVKSSKKIDIPVPVEIKKQTPEKASRLRPRNEIHPTRRFVSPIPNSTSQKQLENLAVPVHSVIQDEKNAHRSITPFKGMYFLRNSSAKTFVTPKNGAKEGMKTFSDPKNKTIFNESWIKTDASYVSNQSTRMTLNKTFSSNFSMKKRKELKLSEL